MSDYTIKDSGDRTEFPTGAVRDLRKGKGRFDLLPPLAMKRLAIHYEKGAEKYGDNNWLKGIPLSKYVDSALRHLFTYMTGINDGEDHAIACAWNLMCLLETQSRVEKGILPKELDDMPRLENNEKNT